MTLHPHLLRTAPRRPDVAVRAPGRANLVGEHTDYNDGLALPLALDLETQLMGRRGGSRVRLTSLNAGGTAEVDLRTGVRSGPEWGRYVAAVVRVLQEEGLRVRGLDGVLASTVPPGAGLSSSAALEVAVALAVLDEHIEPVRLAGLCQRAENAGVGVQTGPMDQLAVACGTAGAALLLDCRDLSVRSCPLPPELAIVLVDSAVPRRLELTAYDDRRRECREAAAALGVRSLRDAREQDLARLDGLLLRRARHVVTENARVLAAVDAFGRLDRQALGTVFATSHASMRDDFETSVAQIDLLVEIAAATEGVVGSRLTGGGFGGCTVSLVERDQADRVLAGVLAEYTRRAGLPARGWVCAPGAPAGRLSLDFTE